jgi:hypothetical protein
LPALRLIAASVLVLLLLPAPARAADPILPLSQVQPGMRCTSLSVIQGLEPVPFDVEVLDVVAGDPASDGPRILIRVSGPAVDATGVGPGFSGSPVLCPDARGVPATVGAISESIGEYGGKVVLATPIEAVLGNPVDAPRATARPSVMRRARPLATPLTVSGLSRPIGAALTRAAARRGRTVVATPAGPLAGFPPQVLRPGSAMGVGYSSGDIAVGAVGTVAYVDGSRVWSFGHELDAAGARNLLLQDAYVYRVINNPNAAGDVGSTYKLAAPSHTVGTLSNDALTAVVGRLGAIPRTIPVRVTARDRDTGRRESVDTDVADETDVGDPLGGPLVSLIGPLAVTQAAAGILKTSPGKVSGDMCAEIAVRELSGRRLRFCNRYVGDGGSAGTENGLANVVAGSAGADLSKALELIGAYTGRALHVGSVKAGVRIERGADLAYMRALDLPARVRPGQKVTATLTVQRLREPRRRVRIPLTMPRDLDAGSRRIILSGTDADSAEEGLFDELTLALGEDDSDSDDRDESRLDEGPQSLDELAREVRAIARYDGVSLFVDSERGDGEPAYRDPDVRLSGRVSARVRVRR